MRGLEFVFGLMLMCSWRWDWVIGWETLIWGCLCVFLSVDGLGDRCVVLVVGSCGWTGCWGLREGGVWVDEDCV